MIDTMGIEYASVKIPSDIYLAWDDHRQHRMHKSYVLVWHGFTKYLPNDASIRYTYYPKIKSGLLKLQFSLPNIIYGNNVQMIDYIEKAVDIANSKMPNVPDIPKLDLWAGTLYRLDVCFNFQVKSLVPWYIKSLLALEFPYRRTRPYTSQGVQYENSRVILRFYDKARERKDLGDIIGSKVARGILRVETELKRAYIQNLTKRKYPTLRSISEEWAYDVIEKELKKLNLLGCSIGTVDSTFELLQKKYGTWEALALIGFLRTKMSYPSVGLFAQDANLHPNSIGRHLQKKFARNGIPPTFTDSINPLPPLFINRGGNAV